MKISPTLRRSALAGSAVIALALSGCAAMQEGAGTPSKETLQVVTDKLELLTLNAGQPTKVLKRVQLSGLAAGDTLVGIDYRIAKGVLFALAKSGRLYTVDTATGVLKPVGAAPAVALQGDAIGMDFNPVADRVRVMSTSGQNVRLHPDTGALAATDPAPFYAAGDRRAGVKPEVAAAAYTYNKKDDKLTTNFAIDRNGGFLVTMGSAEGVQPVVSFNTGQLYTVGALGVTEMSDTSMDIADVSGAAFAAVRLKSHATTRLYSVDLQKGKGTFIGTIGDGARVLGLAVEP
ncbi:DUF4394 domain-containing protein [Rhodoferax sp. TBRC 17660]|uniref:DUF4394 domain-containing protein n=1 Tax=Rhodoferax potami TaxID=3068338 RepID=A0ABU3KS55_9BURK|nr:DUF4394 domain-containing protein [Rhodoferax sp. TBRC 17660]MDT7520323.1 DUF4394 domain-containing protein [Rhodoferax sp. TBRC 17660]